MGGEKHLSSLEANPGPAVEDYVACLALCMPSCHQPALKIQCRICGPTESLKCLTPVCKV